MTSAVEDEVALLLWNIRLCHMTQCIV